ncbi:glycosyltransferase family 2 protein [uncultured Tateyamaria sp.]|uniref:glycosyltransferase family 2 protein n=1 Tax=uncultured Tateyamaria sp. TaxID=455651 RepID=UPI002613598B|nr:glycosyltransferase family 2 protein [uncultured Tateyamaria sp.]
MNKKISVIITTYNVGPYIEQCIASILNQTHQPLEIILVDDASTDETLSIAQALLGDVPDARIISFTQNTPGGVGIPANMGLDQCTGDYIAFADGDDWYEPDMLEKMLEIAERDDADTVMVNYKNFDEANQTIIDPADANRWDLLNQQFRDNENPDVIRRHILRFTPVPWRKLYRASFIHAHQLRFPEGDFFFEDNPLHWFTTIKASRIAILDKIMCYHRVNRPGQTMASNGRELLFFYRHYESTLAWLRAQDTYEEFETDLITWIVSQIEWTSKKITRALWMDLYNEVVDVMSNHSEQAIFSALARNNVGTYGWSLVTAAKFQDLGQFIQILLSGPQQNTMSWERLRDTHSKVAKLEAEVKKLRSDMNAKLLTLDRLIRATLLYTSNEQ